MQEPRTRAQYEAAGEFIERQKALPKDKRDFARIRKALEVMRSSEGLIGPRVEGTSSEMIQAGALEGAPDQPGAAPGSRTMALMDAAGEGARQAVQGAGNFLARPFRTEEEAQQVAATQRQATAKVEVAQEEASRRLGVSGGATRFATGAGKVLTDVAAGGAVGALPRRGARILAEGGVGALVAGAEVSPDKDATFASSLGAIGGMAIGTALEIPGIGRDIMIREFKKAGQSREAREGFQLDHDTGIPLTLGEASGSPAVQRAEAAVPAGPGSRRGQFYEQRRRRIVDSWAETEAALNPENLSTEAVIRASKQLYETRVSELGAAASANFRTNLSPIAERVGATIDARGRIIGGERVIPTRARVAELESQLAQGREAPASLSRGEQTALERRIQELRDNPAMTLGKAQEELSTLTELATGTGQVVTDRLSANARRMSRDELSALRADLEAAEQTPGLATEVATALRQARETYRQDMEAVNALQETAVNRLLGKVGDPEAEDFAQGLLKLPRRQLTDLLYMVEGARPGMANAIRGRIFAELVDKHRVANTADTLQMDLRQFLGEFEKMGAEKYAAVTGLNLADPAARQAQRGLAVLRRIAGGPEAQAVEKSFVQKMEGYAINAFSLNLPFVARMVTGDLGPRYLERLLFTPEGVASLQRLGDPKVTRGAFVQTLVSLNSDLLQSDAELEKIKKEQVMQQVKQAGYGGLPQ
jgi:hypothetical protein